MHSGNQPKYYSESSFEPFLFYLWFQPEILEQTNDEAI